MAPLRILLVTQYFWPEAFRVNDLALGLRERGHDVEVWTGLPNYPEGRFFEGYGLAGPLREDYRGIAVHRAPLVPRGSGRAVRLALNYASFAFTATVGLLLQRRRWDVALVYQLSPVTSALPALALRARSGPPVMLWVQDLWPESIASSSLVRSRALVSLVGRLSRWIYRSADSVIGQSRSFVERLRAVGVPADRVAYVPNWAEGVYRPVTPSPGTRHPWEDGFPVLFAGNLGRVQALDVILEAATLLRGEPDVHWVFVGDGALRAWLEREVAARGLTRVHLLGRRPAGDMPDLFARAGALLVSLKSDPVMAMTVPGKVQSYLASGRPVLASMDGEGARVVEESGAGFASPADDAAALAANVLRMRDLSPEERAARGRAGREYCNRWFDRGACLDEIERRLRELARTE